MLKDKLVLQLMNVSVSEPEYWISYPVILLLNPDVALIDNTKLLSLKCSIVELKLKLGLPHLVIEVTDELTTV